MIMHLNLSFCTFFYNSVMKSRDWPNSRTGAKYPSLKIALAGIFRLVSVRHRYQRVELPPCTGFHAGIRICMIHVLTAQISDLATKCKSSLIK